MGAEALSNRANWQMGARITGDHGENQLVERLAPCLPEHYEIIPKPPKIVIYDDGKGIKLDVKIVNSETGECLFIENKSGNQGGNAHERVYKFLSPSLKQKVRSKFKTPANPFFLIFSGETFTGEAANPGQPFFKKNEDGSIKLNKKGKKTKVDPQKYIDELTLLLSGENYAVAGIGFANIEEIAAQIMEII